MAQMEQNNTITPKQIEPFRPTSFQMPGPTGESPPCRVSRPCRAEPCPIPGGTLALKRIGSWPTKPILRGGADGAETARRRREDGALCAERLTGPRGFVVAMQRG